MGGWTNLTFTLETKSKRDSPPCTLTALCLRFCLGSGGCGLTICGNRGPICVVGMLALSGGCLLPNMEGQRRGGPLQPLGLAWPSCCLRGGPSPRPSHAPHAHAQPCPSLSFHQLCIVLTVLPDPSLCRQPSFVCCCIFPHITRPTQDSILFFGFRGV